MKQWYTVGYRDNMDLSGDDITECLEFESQEEALKYATDFMRKNIEIIAVLAEMED